MKNKFLTLVAFLTLLLSSAQLSANDLMSAVETYISFKDQLHQSVAKEPRPKTINTILVEGILISGRNGTVTKTVEPFNGPVTRIGLEQIARPLYQDGGYSLYEFEGKRLQVWFEQENFASVISLMQYIP